MRNNSVILIPNDNKDVSNDEDYEEGIGYDILSPAY